MLTLVITKGKFTGTLFFYTVNTRLCHDNPVEYLRDVGLIEDALEDVVKVVDLDAELCHDFVATL